MHSSPDRPRESRVIPRGEFAFSTLLLQKLLPKMRRCAKAEMLEKQPLTRNRTKSAKSEGLERTGPRERISSSDRLTAVPRFVREARGYWRFHRGKIQRRTLAAAGLAEGKELGSNGLLIWRVLFSTWECDWDPNRALKCTKVRFGKISHLTRKPCPTFGTSRRAID